MITGIFGLLFNATGTFSILRTTNMPSITRPKIEKYLNSEELK